MARKITVVDYNPNWVKEYKAEAKKLQAILGKNCVAVHHFGSTSVKGMKAKPTIDLMAVVKEDDQVMKQLDELRELGYEYKGEFGIAGRAFFVKGGDEHTHHLHIYKEKNKKAIGRHLAVREYLKAHPETAKEYGELKLRLAEEFPYDANGYCNGKDRYVSELEEKAMAWSEEQVRQGNYTAFGLCIGLAIGCFWGSVVGDGAFGTMSLYMCLGMCVGMAIGAAVGAIKGKKNKKA